MPGTYYFSVQQKGVFIAGKVIYYASFFEGLKIGPAHIRKKNVILRDSKRSSFITDFFFFELLFDTATLIILSLRMLEVANRASNLIQYTRYTPG